MRELSVSLRTYDVLYGCISELYEDMKTQFYVEKKAVYAKINTVGKCFPMKVKISGNEGCGAYDFYFSFFHAYPDKDKSIEEFPRRKDHLYKFNKPK